MNDKPDNLYARPLGNVAGFVFDKAVVDVFPDMIRRSVPGYETIIAMTGTLAEHHAQPNSRCYDLGCSLGASTRALAKATEEKNCRIVAVDNSPDMVARCRELLPEKAPVELLCADIRDIAVANASVVVLNFTLQFVPPVDRETLLSGIYNGLNPGGILILSEKVAFADPQHDKLMTTLHHHFKRAQGYSDLEISQKRAALEKVLIPETLDCHRNRLKKIGFASVDVWFQCFNFASLVAQKVNGI